MDKYIGILIVSFLKYDLVHDSFLKFGASKINVVTF